MKRLLIPVFTLFALTVFGEHHWVGGDGSWNDPNMWDRKTVPTASDLVQFSAGRGGRVLVDGDVTASCIHVGEDGKIEEEIAPVEFYGGGTITAKGNMTQLFGGRHVIVKDVMIDATGKGFCLKYKDGVGGYLEIQPGGSCIGADSRNYIYTGSTVFINGGYMSGNLTVETGATFRMSDGTYEFIQKAPTVQSGATVVLSGGRIISKPAFGEAHSAFIDRSGAETAIAGGATLYALDGVRVLPKVLSVTNASKSTIFAVYSNMTFLSRGTLCVDEFEVRNKSVLSLRVPELQVGKMLDSPTSGAEIDLYGDTWIRARGDWTFYNALKLMSDGSVRLDTDDADGGAAHELQQMRVGFGANGSLEVTGEGSVSSLLFLDPSAGASVPRSLKLPSADLPCWTHCASRGAAIFFRDIEIGADAKINLPCRNSIHAYSNSCYHAFCKSTVDPTAHFNVQITTNGYFDAKGNYQKGALTAGSLYAVFLGGPKSAWLDPDQFTLEPSNGDPAELGAWQLKFVGPMAYLSDGLSKPSTGDGYWCGAVSGYTSDPKNWCNEMTTASATYFVGEKHAVVTNDIENWGQKGFRTNTTSGPFILRGNAITLNRDAAILGSSSSFYHNGSFPFLFEAPMKLADKVTKLTFMVNSTSRLSLLGAMDFTGASVGLGGDIQVGSTLVCRSIWFGPNKGRANALTVLEDATMTVTGQDDCLTNGIFIVQGGGKLKFTGGEFCWAMNDRVNTVDGVVDFQVSLSGACDLGFSGTGVVNVASVKSSSEGNAAVQLGGKIHLVPATDWTTVTEDSADTAITLALPKWGRATLAPTGDFTYGPAAGVTPTTDAAARAFVCGDYSELTVESDHTVAFADPLVFGQHTKLVKKGAGRLTISAADVLPEALELEAGTLVLSAPETVGSFAAAEGTTLELAAGASVTVTDEDLSLDGLNVTLAGDAPQAWTTLFTVSPLRTISGMPTLPDDVKAKFVVNGDGSVSLVTKAKRGMMLLLR